MDEKSIDDLNFTAIDFETANSCRASVCAVGLVKVESGRVIQSMHQLVRPPEGFNEFSPHNFAVHGITADDVLGAPRWDTVYQHVLAFVGTDDLVAHNAPFDRSVFQQASSVYDLDWPENKWFDTLQFSKDLLTLSSYSLPFVASHLQLEETRHHHAEQDALQAARIAVELASRENAASLSALFDSTRTSAIASSSSRRAPGDFSTLAGDSPLAGEFVVFTGKLNTTTRTEAQALVGELGGESKGTVSKSTTMVVTGDFDPRTFRPGAELTKKLERAQELFQSGQPIEILTEMDFLERIEVTREELEAATRDQRVASKSGWLPDYVIDQARAIADPTLEYSRWLRMALSHPEGADTDEMTCVRCSMEVTESGYWLYRERHVCSADCNESLKRAAKRAWKRESVVIPAIPDYDPRWSMAQEPSPTIQPNR